MPEIRLERLVKRYGEVEVLHGIELEMADNEFTVLVGPSGCGKSTTLRMIAGLEDVSEGEIWVGDKPVKHLEPKDRDLAMVFQDYALYPHMNVAQNISFALRLAKRPKAEIDAKVREVFTVVKGDRLDATCQVAPQLVDVVSPREPAGGGENGDAAIVFAAIHRSGAPSDRVSVGEIAPRRLISPSALAERNTSPESSESTGVGPLLGTQ